MLENTILSHLVFNDSYARKVLPFLKTEYFTETTHNVVFSLIEAYMVKYNKTPTREALLVELDAKNGLSETLHAGARDIVTSLASENTDEQWLLDKTEEFCQKKALFNAIMASITIMEGESKESEGNIPNILSQALAVSFDTHIGHDYINDAEERYQYYITKENRLPFDIDILNEAFAGGVANKTLNVLLAPTGVGKTLVMCHLASSYLKMGMDVLYITLEMAEKEIARRIDANLLDVPMAELETLPKDMYDKKLARLRGNTKGNLVIKEYPTASANVGHFRHLLNELRLKKNFTPKVVFVDYINICSSARVKFGNNINSYQLVKSISEELRGLAVEFDLPIWTATQTNRGGFDNADIDLDDTSESFGLPMTVDYMAALIRTEELDKLNQLMWKQLKSRYADKSNLPKFMIGIDRSKMRLYNTEAIAQDDLDTNFGKDNDQSVFDKSGFGQKDTDYSAKANKWKKMFV